MNAPSVRYRLEELTTSIDYGVTASATNAKVGPQFLRITDIQNDRVDWRIVPYCEASTREEDAARLQVDDIVFARTGATTGKSFLLRTCPERAVFASYLIRVRPNQARVEPRYLSWYFQTPEYWRQITSSASGTAQPGVNASKLSALSIPVPPVPEQRRIADILDKADVIRRKRKEALSLTEELLRSAFLEMFGDPVTNPKGWPVKPFAELVSETQLGLVRAAAEQRGDRAYSYVRMNAIRSDGHMDLSNLTRVDASEDEVESSRLMDGDFLFNTRNSRELVGKAAVYHGDGTHLFNNNILRVRFRSGVEPDFVSAYWQTSAGQQHLEARKAGTTSVFAIYYKSLATLPVPVPPAHAQAKYADVCAATRKHLRTDEAYVEEADALFNSLVARAFSGALEASR